MSITFGLWRDAARTQPVDALVLAGIADPLAAPTVQRLFVGPAVGKRAMAVDGQPIQLSISGTAAVPASAWRLALSEQALAQAQDGAPLALTAQLDDALPVWLRVDCRQLAQGNYDGLFVNSTQVKEVAL